MRAPDDLSVSARNFRRLGGGNDMSRSQRIRELERRIAELENINVDLQHKLAALAQDVAPAGASGNANRTPLL